MSMEVKPGIYRHYKGTRVIGVLKHTGYLLSMKVLKKNWKAVYYGSDPKIFLWKPYLSGEKQSLVSLMLGANNTFVSIDSLQDEAVLYLKSLNTYFEDNGITELLKPPIDHFAIKALDTNHYEKLLEDLIVFCNRLTYTKIDNRRLATGFLISAIDFGALGNTHIIELMEPKPAVTGKRSVGFEHIELFTPELSTVGQKLREKHVHFSVGGNLYHTTYILLINQEHQELKFTDTKLADVITKEKQEGNVYSMK